jgi:hypothetical protein
MDLPICNARYPAAPPVYSEAPMPADTKFELGPKSAHQRQDKIAPRRRADIYWRVHTQRINGEGLQAGASAAEGTACGWRRRGAFSISRRPSSAGPARRTNPA